MKGLDNFEIRNNMFEEEFINLALTFYQRSIHISENNSFGLVHHSQEYADDKLIGGCLDAFKYLEEKNLV